MAFLPLFRIAVLTLTVIFSIIVLGISAHILNVTLDNANAFFTFSALALAVSLLTLLTVIPMFIIDVIRPGTILTSVVAEVVWLSILWVLWLAAGADTADANNRVFGASCGSFSFIPSVENTCNEFNAVEAFSFLNFILLLIYTVTLAVAVSRRTPDVWRGSVRDLGPDGGAGFGAGVTGANASYPMEQPHGAPASGGMQTIGSSGNAAQHHHQVGSASGVSSV